jgi:hypothetical protein
MVKMKQIEDFISSQPVAMVGVSRNPKKFGFAAFKELTEKGMSIIPVNANADEIHQVKTIPSLEALPPGVKSLLIMTRKEQTAGVVREAKERGITNIWIQQMSESPEALKELDGSGVNYITNQCILMYYKPNGIHKFHRALKKFFGGLPK